MKQATRPVSCKLTHNRQMVSLRIPIELKDWLKERSLSTGISQADLISQALIKTYKIKGIK